MALTARDRRELLSETKDRLSQVIGASGKAEELVKLTTQIVQACKKLVEGTPEGLRTRSTATLAEFVIAAKKIAQDTRAVDSASLQKLSSSRKAVDSLVDELDVWHSSRSSGKDEVDMILEDILGTGPPESGCSGGGMGRKTSPTDRRPSSSSAGSASVASEHERRMVAELKSIQDELMRRKEPQEYPTPLQGQTEDTLKMVGRGLSRCTSQLMDQASQKAPCREALLEPATTAARLICTLLDVVDNLFVSKYPMRPQVHSFTCAMLEQVGVYGTQSRSDDTASLRVIATQVPALMNALEVMLEQTSKRSQNVKENQMMSLQRNADLHDLDVNGPGHSPRSSPVNHKRKEPPPAPPSKATPPVVQEFEVAFIVCTSVAVDTSTKELRNKGSEVILKVTANTTVLDVRKMLMPKTSLSLQDIQLRFRGDDVLTDNTRMTPDNPVPYFLFNLNEPGEEEMVEFRREQRRKNRLRIDTTDWSKVPSPVAVAIYDYEAMAEPGEEDNLEFEEGDLIEIIEKSADGWWTGCVDGKEGVFPASFVEMIQIPQTKEERKKLLKRYRQGRLGEAGNNDVAEVEEQAPPPRPPQPKFQQPPQQQEPPISRMSSSVSSSEISSGGGGGRSGSFSKPFSRSHRSSTGSEDTDGSPSPTKKPSFGKLDRNTSEPNISMAEQASKDGKQKKRRSLFKKKPPPSYMALTDDFQRSPILMRRDSDDSREAIPELEEELPPPTRHPLPPSSAGAAPDGPTPGGGLTQSATVPARLFRPKSSPRSPKKGRSEPGDNKSLPSQLQRRPSGDKVAEGVGAGPKPAPPGGRPVSRRPPPPPPYAKRYGTQGMKMLVKRSNSDSKEGEEDDGMEEEKAQPPPPPPPSLSSGQEDALLPSFEKDDGKNDVDDSGLVMMMVTPASPLVLDKEEHGGKTSREEEEEGSLPPVTSSNSMEDLFKNLEEFDELSSNQSLNNGGGLQHHSKDYTSIPEEELRQVKGNSQVVGKLTDELPRCASVPAKMGNPPIMEDRPCLTPSPQGTATAEGGSSTARTAKGVVGQEGEQAAEPVYSIPVKPPRSRTKKKKTSEEDSTDRVASVPLATASRSQPPPPPPPSSKRQSYPVASKPHPPPPFSKPQGPPTSSKPHFPPKATSTSVLNRPVFKAPRPPKKPPSPDVLEEVPKDDGNGGRVREEASSPSAPPRRKARVPKSTSDLSVGVGKPAPRPKPPQMSRIQVDVMLKKQLECASAPVSRTASPDDAEQQQQRLRQDSSTSTTDLATKAAVRRADSSELTGGEADSCTGVGKEGMLHLESAGKHWMPRYFKLQPGLLAYFDISAPTDNANPLGQFATSKIDEVVHVGEKNRLHCFSLKIQGDKDTLLGCNSKMEMEDWMKSIHKVARQSKRRGRMSGGSSSSPSSLCYKTAVGCVSYLSSSHLVRQDRLISPAAGNPVLIKRQLAAIGNSEEVDLNSLEEAGSVLGLLLALFDKSYLGPVVSEDLVRDMCSSMQSADPISAMAAVVEKLTPKFRELLKKILKFFSKVIQYSDKNNTGVQDINAVFGSVIFENISPSQSERLLGYLISTFEFIIT